MSSRFPWRSLLLSALCGGIVLLIELLVRQYCAFGFGGFQCNAPLTGWGSALFVAVLIFAAACLVFGLYAARHVLLWLRS